MVLSEGNPFIIACHVCNYYRLGEIDHAEKLFEDLKKRLGIEYVPATCFFLIHRIRGEENQALEWLKRACTEHDTWLPLLRVFPFVIPEGSKIYGIGKGNGAGLLIGPRSKGCFKFLNHIVNKKENANLVRRNKRA